MRIGFGYDIHRLTEGRQMVLGGVKIPYPKGPEGHSDGDVLLHAVCDAVLGAMGRGDIGMRFPDTDDAYRDISSTKLLRDVAGLMRTESMEVHNLDCVVIVEEPKIGPYREEMIRVISDILKCPAKDVNVKGKTSEKMDAVGVGAAVAAYASVLLDE